MSAFKTVALLSAAAVVTTDHQFSTGSVADAVKINMTPKKVDKFLAQFISSCKNQWDLKDALETTPLFLQNERYWLRWNKCGTKFALQDTNLMAGAQVVFYIKKESDNNNWKIMVNNLSVEGSEEGFQVSVQLVQGLLTGLNGKLKIDEDLTLALTNFFGADIVSGKAENFKNKIKNNLRKTKKAIEKIGKKYIGSCTRSINKMFKSSRQAQQQSKKLIRTQQEKIENVSNIAAQFNERK